MIFLKMQRCILIVIFFFLIFNLVQLYRKYGELIYIQTFLPAQELPLQQRNFMLSERKRENSSRSWNGSRILCMIVTSPPYHSSRAVHVAATWARHCSRAIFVTSEADSRLPDFYVVAEAAAYKDLWIKVSKGFEIAFEENLTSLYDWFLKVDDDTFVFLENLKKVLHRYDPNQLVAFGHKLLTWEENAVYLSGGAGYVLSKATLKQLVTRGLRNKDCERNLNLGTNEDVNMSFCLAYLGVTLVDSQDLEGHSQFHVYPPQEVLDPRQEYAWSHLWLKKKSVNSYPFGIETLTSQPVTFHYVNAETMYFLYYLVYVIHPSFEKHKDRKRA